MTVAEIRPPDEIVSLISELRSKLRAAENRVNELEGRLAEALASPVPVYRLDLSPRQRAIYAVLKRAQQSNPTGFVPRERILISVWGYEAEIKSVDVIMYYLRDRLAQHETIEAVWGGGYRLVAAPDEKRLAEIEARKARDQTRRIEAPQKERRRGRPAGRAKA